MPRKRPEHVLAQIGDTGLPITGLRPDTEWHRELRGTRGVRQFREMSDNSSVIGGALYAAEVLIRQATWEFVAADESSSEAKEVADKANTMLHDMENTWPEVLSDILTMLSFGWSLHVDSYKIRRGPTTGPDGGVVGILDSQHDDGMYGWRNIEIRDQESLWGWEWDEATGKATAMIQRGPPRYEEHYIPLERAMLFRFRNNRGSPEGRSALRNAWRDYFYLKRIQEHEAIGVERDLAGLPVMEVPLALMSPGADAATKSVRADYETKIQKIRRDQLEGLVIPAEVGPDGKPTGYKFRLASTGGRRPIDVNEIIKRYESRILISLFSEFLLIGQDKVGSFSLHSDKTALFAMGLGAIMDSITTTMNRGAVSRVMELNAIDRRIWPTLEHGDVEKEKAGEVVNSFLAAVQAGVAVPTDEDESHVRSLLDWPQRGVDDTPRQLPQQNPQQPGVLDQLPLFDDE